LRACLRPLPNRNSKVTLKKTILRPAGNKIDNRFLIEPLQGFIPSVYGHLDHLFPRLRSFSEIERCRLAPAAESVLAAEAIPLRGARSFLRSRFQGQRFQKIRRDHPTTAGKASRNRMLGAGYQCQRERGDCRGRAYDPHNHLVPGMVPGPWSHCSKREFPCVFTAGPGSYPLPFKRLLCSAGDPTRISGSDSNPSIGATASEFR